MERELEPKKPKADGFVDDPKSRDHLYYEMRRHTRRGHCAFCGAGLTGRRTAWCSDACRDAGFGLFWQNIRRRILRKADFKCAGCGENATTVHHILPMARGGTSEDSNLEPLCKSCHLARHKEIFCEIVAEREAEAVRRLTLSHKPLFG